MRGNRKALCVLACAIAGVASPALAAPRFWINPAGGSFHLATNWAPTVPGAGDDAIFNLGSALPYAVALSLNVTNEQLDIANDNVQLTFTPGVIYSLTAVGSGVPSVIVGDAFGDNGQLNLVNATITAAGQVVVGNSGIG